METKRSAEHEALLEKFKSDFENMGRGEIIELAEDFGWTEPDEPEFVDKCASFPATITITGEQIQPFNIIRSAETQANEWYDAVEEQASTYIAEHLWS